MLEIKDNEPLSKYSTYKIGGLARYFIAVRSKEDILEAIGFAKQKNLPFFLLGGGSNILFNDSGYDGVIIKIQLGGLKINGRRIIAGAGVLLSQLINNSVDSNLAGLEWGVGIPGTIGGAVNGNAGAYGSSISEKVESVVVLDENGQE
ncbi:MAG: FAD-binding protein [Patescibacteria group bacterium]